MGNALVKNGQMGEILMAAHAAATRPAVFAQVIVVSQLTFLGNRAVVLGIFAQILNPAQWII